MSDRRLVRDLKTTTKATHCSGTDKVRGWFVASLSTVSFDIILKQTFKNFQELLEITFPGMQATAKFCLSSW